MAPASDVKVLGFWASPFVSRVQFALHVKSVDYEFQSEDLGAKSELLLKSNPVHKKVPVLVHGDKPVCESTIIVEYIDEAWSDGPRLLPSDPFDRATARFWAAYIDEKWALSMWSLAAATEDTKPEVLEKILEGLALLEDVFVKSSNGNEFFGGENLGYLDFVLGSLLGWVKALEIQANVTMLDATKTPRLVKWSEKFTSHEAVKGALPEAEELLNLLRMRAEKAKAAAAEAEAEASD